MERGRGPRPSNQGRTGTFIITLCKWLLLCVFIVIPDPRHSSQNVQDNPQARSHPLFPILENISNGLVTVTEKITAVETKQCKVEQEVREIKRIQDELNRLVQETTKKSFNLKESGFEV